MMRYRAMKKLLKIIGVWTVVLIISCIIFRGSLRKAAGGKNDDTRPHDRGHSFEVARKNVYLEVGLTNVSRTKPASYPINGTGKTVNVTAELGMSVFSVGSFKMAYNVQSDWHKLCQSDVTLDAIVPIYSAPDNYARRAAVRNTVGKECRHVFRCRIVFIIGMSLNHSINAAVKQELDTEHDIVIINKIDTYRDLNNKAVAMLDWLVKVCPGPKYVIHTIDDTYPNLKYIFHHLKNIRTNKFILGRRAVSGKPVRNRDSRFSKWFLSRLEYPYDQLPPYIVGTAYAFLNEDCPLLREKVHTTEYVWIEDIWFTGLVAKAAGFKMIRFATSGFGDQLEPDIYMVAAHWNKLPYIHNVPPALFHDIFSMNLAANHFHFG